MQDVEEASAYKARSYLSLAEQAIQEKDSWVTPIIEITTKK